MNYKLNLKVLRQMWQDFEHTEQKVLMSKKLKIEQKIEFQDEIKEKKKAVNLLFKHYKTIVDFAEGRKSEG